MMMWIIDLSRRLSKECQQLLRQSISGASKCRRPLLLRCLVSDCSRLQTAAAIRGRKTPPCLERRCSGFDKEGGRCAPTYMVMPSHTHTCTQAQ